MAISLASKMVCSSLVFFGMAGAAVFGGNELSKITISDSLGEAKLVSEKTTDKIEETLWTSLTAFSLLKKEAKSEKFKNLSSIWKSKINIEGNKFWDYPEDLKEASKELKQLCEDSRNKKYSSWFSIDDDLMEDVKNFCSEKIIDIFSWHGDNLDFSNETYKSEERNFWVKNLDSLKEVEEPEHDLDSKISDLKKSLSQNQDYSEETVKSLFNWCKRNMNLYYINKEENNIFLTGEYCRKIVDANS